MGSGNEGQSDRKSNDGRRVFPAPEKGKQIVLTGTAVGWNKGPDVKVRNLTMEENNNFTG